MSRGQRFAVWLAILAGLQMIAASTALPNLLPADAAQWIQLLVGAADAATAAYLGYLARPTLPSTRVDGDG